MRVPPDRTKVHKAATDADAAKAFVADAEEQPVMAGRRCRSLGLREARPPPRPLARSPGVEVGTGAPEGEPVGKPVTDPLMTFVQ